MNTSRAVRIAVVVLCASGLATIAACGSSSTAPDTTAANAAIVGAYTLKTVDGATLPAPAKDDKGVVAGTFTSGSVTLASDGTFTANTNYTLTNGTTAASPANGTYSVSGSTVTFLTGGATKVATFSGGNTLTLVDNQTRVYTK